MDWILMIVTSTFVLQIAMTFLLSKMVQVFSGLFLSTTLSEADIVSSIIYKSSFLGTVLSLPLTLLVVYWRRILFFNRKQLTKKESFIVRGLNQADWKFLVKYIPTSYILYLLGNGIIVSIFGEAEAVNQMAVESMFNYIPLWQMFLMIVIVAPIVEELLFRGLILFAGDRLETSWLRVIVSATLFGMIHNPTNMQSVYTYVGMGLVFAYAGKRTNSIEAPIIYHFINNLIGFLAILTIQ